MTSFRTCVAASLTAGLLVALNFDPVALPGVALAGLATFFVIGQRMAASPFPWWQVAAAGFAFGLGFMGPLIWWMNAVDPLAYVALTIAQALYFAPTLLLLRLVARLPWWPVAMALVWTLGESVRSAFPLSGFPWGRLAHLTIDTPLQSYVRWVGQPATSFVVALVAGALAWLVVRPRPRHHLLVVTGAIAVVILVGAALPTGLAGGDRGATAQIAIVQGNIPGRFFTWKRGDIFKLHAAATDRLANRVEQGEVVAPDLVLWPENSTDVDPLHDKPQADRIEDLASRVGAPILVGGLFDGPTVDTAYNAGVVWASHGPADRYVKRKVVPYGEYVPLRRVFGPLVPQFDRFIPRDMLPGDQTNVLSGGGVVFGDTICWDIAFDGLLREAVRGGAQFVVVQTSNASFTGTAQPEQQFKIARLRALEAGRWVVIPSTNGISAVVDADGRVVERAPMHQPALLTASVPLAAGPTVGITLGPWLQWGLGLGAVAALAWAWRRP